MLSRSFPSQRYLHNVRQTIFGTFLSRCCVVFEQVNDWLDVSFCPSLCSGWCFVNTGICLFKFSTVVSDLFLCCCAVIEQVSAWWVVSCLDWPETVFGSAFLLLLCNLHHTVLTPEPNDNLHFFCVSFERHWRHFTVQRHLLWTCLTHCLSRYTEIC